MADKELKALLLQVDASTELLRTNLAAANKYVQQSTAQWQNDLKKSDSAFGNVGKSLGPLKSRIQDINRITRQYADSTGYAAAKAREAEKAARAHADTVANGLRRASGLIATYFGTRELIAITDAYTQFVNSIRVAGVAEGDRKAIQDQLFASAQKYGVELNALGQLYGRAAQAASELGATQSDLLRFTDGVAAALKVQGGSIEAARGALLQLAQAMQSGTVRAEEYNSVNEGAFPILQAVAAGSERFGGSVAKLRKAVIDGTVSSKEFFQAFLAGSKTLEDRAAKATLTTAAGFTTLRNALIVYVGEANEVSGASAALGLALKKIADNLDILIPALTVIGTALGVGFVVNATKAAIAARGVGAAMTTAFGGPVGAAITAVTVAIGTFATEWAKTRELIQHANAAHEESKQRMEAAAVAAGKAADGNAQLGKDALGAIPKVNAFAGAVGNLAQKLYEQARAARVARAELLQKQLDDSRRRETDLAARTPAGRDASAADLKRGDFLNNAGIIIRNAVGSGASVLSGGRTDREAVEAYGQQVRESQRLAAELKKARDTSTITASDLPGGGVAEPGAGKKKKGPKGPSAEALRVKAVRDEAAYQNDLRRARMEELAVQADLTNDLAMRADIERQRVEFEKQQIDKDIAADGPTGTKRYTAAQVAELQSINARIALGKIAVINMQERERIREEELRLASADRENQRDVLEGQARLARTSAERLDLELRLLDLQYAEERARLEGVLASETATKAEKEIARRRLEILGQLQANDREETTRRNEGPTAAYRRSINMSAEEVNEAIDGIAVDGLRRINDDLAAAIMGTKSLGAAFKDMANQIIGELIRIAIQQAIIKPLANSLFGGGGGGLGSIGSILGSAKSIFGFADGGEPPVNRPSWVGERGVELFVPKVAGTIVPNHMLGGGRSAPSVTFAPTINAPGATAETVAMIRRELQNAAPVLIDAAKAATFRDLNRARLP